MTPHQIHRTVLRRGTMVSTAVRWQQSVCWGTSAAGTVRSCRSSIEMLRGKCGDEEEELLHQSHGKFWLRPAAQLPQQAGDRSAHPKKMQDLGREMGLPRVTVVTSLGTAGKTRENFS